MKTQMNRLRVLFLCLATPALTQCDDRRTENQKPRTGTPGDNRDTSTPTQNSDGSPRTQP